MFARRHHRLAGRLLPAAAAGLCLLLLAGSGRGAVVFEIYRAQPGDTVESIAAKFGVDAATIRARNGIDAKARIHPGDTLVVPIAASTAAELRASGSRTRAAHETSRGGRVAGHVAVTEVCTVQPGETVESIAARYGVDPAVLRARNGLTLREKVEPGRTLQIERSEQDLVEDAPPLPEKRQPPTVTRATSTVVASDGGTTQSSQHSLGQLGTVAVTGGDIRRQPNPHARVVYRTSPGVQLVVTGQSGDWYAVMMIDRSNCWIPKKYVHLEGVDLVAASPSQGGNYRVIEAAMRYLGIPYHYGGNGRGGIDCSALVRNAYAAIGVYLPRTAAAQYDVGQAVPPEMLQPGDRLYFSKSGTRIDHTGLYMGNGMVIHASGSAGCVTVDSLYSPKLSSIFVGARR